MRPKDPRHAMFWMTVAFLATVPTAYWAGYNAGLAKRGPELWGLVVVRKNGTSYSWYDVNEPQAAELLRADERKLKVSGANYYLAKGLVTTTTEAPPDPRRVNAHR